MKPARVYPVYAETCRGEKYRRGIAQIALLVIVALLIGLFAILNFRKFFGKVVTDNFPIPPKISAPSESPSPSNIIKANGNINEVKKVDMTNWKTYTFKETPHYDDFMISYPAEMEYKEDLGRDNSLIGSYLAPGNSIVDFVLKSDVTKMPKVAVGTPVDNITVDPPVVQNAGMIMDYYNKFNFASTVKVVSLAGYKAYRMESFPMEGLEKISQEPNFPKIIVLALDRPKRQTFLIRGDMANSHDVETFDQMLSTFKFIN